MRTNLPVVGAFLLLAGCASEDTATPPPPLFGAARAPAASAVATPTAPATIPPPEVVGTWQGTVRDRSRRGGQMQTWRLELAPDGSYRSISAFAQGGHVQHWGRYVAGAGFIRLSLEGWEPRQECGDAGCYPLEMPSTDTVVLVSLDRQQMVTEQGPLQRLQ